MISYHRIRLWLRSLRLRLRFLFRKTAVEAELDEELRFHVESAIENNLNAGMSEKEARRQALLAFGGTERYKEQVRDARGVRALENIMLDLRVAVRRLRKHKALSLVAILSLALGIGANSALFSVVKAVLLNPLPYPDPAELVFVWETRGADGSTETTVSPGNFQEWRQSSSSRSRPSAIQSMAAIQRRPYNVTGRSEPKRLAGLQVSSGFFSVLQLGPTSGRGFLPEEERPGAEAICLVSQQLWEAHFGEEGYQDGRALILDGQPHTIVGMLPDGFSVPGIGSPSILAPLVLDPTDPNFRGNHNAVVLARLADAGSFHQASEELSGVTASLRDRFPEWNEGIGVRLRPARDQMVQGVRQNLWFLFGAVGLVLVLACVNLASLFLARAVSAEREIAVRKALGAPRFRLIRLTVTEALILAFAGGALGFGLCAACVEGLRSFGPAGIPRLATVSVDPAVLGFTAITTVAAALVFGLIPALLSSRVNILAAVQALGRQAGLSSQTRITRVFVAAEIGLSVVLLVCFGLLLRTFQEYMRVDPGFEAEGRLALMVSLPAQRYDEVSKVTAFLRDMVEEVEAIPGVRTAGASIGLPFQALFWRKFATVEGSAAPTLPEVPVVDLSIATPGFLETAGIPVIRGRSILEGDGEGAPLVALVNEEFARLYLEGREPLGRRIRLGAPDALLPPEQRGTLPWHTIVGLVGNVHRRGLNVGVQPEVFIPQAQDRDLAREFYVVAHTGGEFPGLPDALRQAVWGTDPNQPVAWVRSLEDMYDQAVSRPRLNLILMGAFGAASLILALGGVYGLMAHAVSLRTGEIGVRVAVGARPVDILGEMVGWGVRIAVIGLALGLVSAVIAARLMGAMLFGVDASDPMTYGLVSLTVLLAAGLAALLPAWRGARMDPRVALGWN